MISAEFFLREDHFVGVSVRGHAGYASYGNDVVCASVTSAVELTANGITEILKIPASVGVFENEVRIDLPAGAGLDAERFLQALRLHLALLQQDYPENLQLTDTEV